MKKMYYHSFPPAPVAVVSGIAAIARIPSIVGAYVGVGDNSLFLDIYQDEDFRLTAAHLDDIAEFCDVELDEIEVGPGIDEDHVSVTLETTCFDFSDLAKGTRFDAPDLSELTIRVPEGATWEKVFEEYKSAALAGFGDSDESIEAHEKTINRKK